MLEHFQRQDPSLMEKIRGCIVDSAPVANPDPQVKALAILRLGEHSHLFTVFCPMLFILFFSFHDVNASLLLEIVSSLRSAP